MDAHNISWSSSLNCKMYNEFSCHGQRVRRMFNVNLLQKTMNFFDEKVKIPWHFHPKYDFILFSARCYSLASKHFQLFYYRQQYSHSLNEQHRSKEKKIGKACCRSNFYGQWKEKLVFLLRLWLQSISTCALERKSIEYSIHAQNASESFCPNLKTRSIREKKKIKRKTPILTAHRTSACHF